MTVKYTVCLIGFTVKSISYQTYIIIICKESNNAKQTYSFFNWFNM